MRKKFNEIIINHKKEMLISGILVLFLSIFFIGNVFAALTPNESVMITSKNTDYDSKEEGSWQVKKSSKWISKGRARVTFDVDTILMTEDKHTDIILVLDTSASMAGDKLDRVKQDSIELVDSLLADSNNNVALITFNTSSTIVSQLTNDKDVLINQINELQDTGSTNYYQALVNVDNILKDYDEQANRDVVVLFLTGSYPNVDTPNQKSQYQYLKKAYSYITVNAIQYEMGDAVLNPIKEISDNQFIADGDTLNTILREASAFPLQYEEFQIIDYIDSNYFTLGSEESITVSSGKVKLENENGKRKVIWTLDGFISGRSAKLTMDIDLKEEYIGKDAVFSTNEKEQVITKISGEKEDVTSTDTPALAGYYSVTYDGNAPDGATVSNVPSDASYFVFDTVAIDTEEPTCTGYEFKGWEIVTKGVTRAGDDYFIMPEKDVVIKAKWSKVEISKSMDGVVNTKGDPVMKSYRSTEARQTDYHNSKYRTKVTSVVTKDNLEIPVTAIEYWDVSEAGDGSVVAYIEDDGDDGYKVTIGGQGGVIANPDLSYFFFGESLDNSFSSLKTIDFSYLDTSRVTSMMSMFNNCINLTNLDLSNFDTSNVISMGYMFSNCNSLTDLDLSSFDTSKVTNMDYMFNYCSSLSTLNVSSFDTSNVTSMSLMFYHCENLLDLDLNNFNTSKVTTMSNMFNGCGSLINLNLNSFDTSKVTRMDAMFYGCSKLTGLNLSSFDTGRVTDMSNMFNGCNSLTSLDVSNFDTSNVTIMHSMFNYCYNLTSLDLSNFDTSNVTNMAFMFQYCRSLSDLYLDSFDTSNVNNMYYMFYGCNHLTILDVSNFDTSNVTSMGSMFGACSSLITLDVSGFDTSKVTNMSGMFQSCSSLTSLDLSNFDTSNVTNMGSMFSGCRSLSALNVSNFDTSNVTSMVDMFRNCNQLSNLDVSDFDTSNVTTMASMFNGCSGLTSLDVNNFDTSKVVDMGNMFTSCSALTSLDLKGFDTSNVTKLSGMFQNCDSLINLDISRFDTSKVTTMSAMFQNCGSLINLGVSHFDTSNVTNMRDMFHGCFNLGSLDLSSFNTHQVTNMARMFYNCNSLVNLNINNFDTSNVITMEGMFYGCSDLVSLNINNFDTSSVTSMSYMFFSCSGLAEINVNNFDTSNVSDMAHMFRSCKGLINLDISNFDTSNVTSAEYMFSNCSNLISLDMRNAVFDSVTDYSSMFSSINNDVNVIVKDSTAQEWVRSRLNEANMSDATVTIVSDINTDSDVDDGSVISDNIGDDFSTDISFREVDFNSSIGVPLALGYGLSFSILY